MDKNTLRSGEEVFNAREVKEIETHSKEEIMNNIKRLYLKSIPASLTGEKHAKNSKGTV